MSHVTVEITGANEGWKFREMIQLLGPYRHVYCRGTDKEYYVDMFRQDADLFIANIVNTPGVSARIIS